MIDPAAFEPAMPAAVRAVLAEARAGRGVAAEWLARGEAPDARVSECLALANRREVDAVVLGWLVGMTLFEDERQRLALVLQRPSHRDPALPHVLDAFAAGIVAGLAASGRLWTRVEALARRLAHVPPALIAALPVGLVSKQALARSAALRIAQRAGAPAREAIEAARARAPDPRLDEALATLGVTGESPLDGAGEAGLLLDLVAEWRATHDPVLEPLILHLGRKVGNARGELVSRSRGELEVAWRALAETLEPLDLSRLLDAPWPSAWKQALERVRLLAGFPADPRVPLRLAEVALAHGSIASRPLHEAIAAVLARTPALSVLPVLDAIELQRANAAIYARARAALATLAIQPANPDLLAMARSAASPYELAALEAEHLANPADLDARAVLADALQLAGDPRGELIALQLAVEAGTAGEGATRRIDALIDQHGDVWAPLPIERGRRRFARGFLVELESRAPAELLARFAERPEWRTVERATFTTAADVTALVRRLPLLVWLAAPRSALAALAASGPTPGVRLVHCIDGGYVPPVGAFPDLATLAGTWFTDRTWSPAEHADLERRARERGVRRLVHHRFPGFHLARAIQCSAGVGFETCFTDEVAPALDAGWRIRVGRAAGIVDVATGSGIALWLLETVAATGADAIALHLDPGLRQDLVESYGQRETIGRVPVIRGTPIDFNA